jgi:cobalt/nickel transport system permease protein
MLDGIPSGKRSRLSSIEKGVNEFLSLIERAIFSEEMARKDGLLQGMDPRAKLAAMVCLIVFASLFKRPETLAALYLIVTLMALLSKLDILSFTKRIWFFIPIFTGIIAIPAVFNVITPGTPILVVARLKKGVDFGPWHIPEEIAITKEGVESAVLFVIRVATSVSIAVVVVLTTRWSDLLKALRAFRVPAVFVLILGMTYRYVFILVRVIQDMYMARKSRTIVYRTKGERIWVASRIAVIAAKSYAMSERVFMAMKSRGFTGDVRTMTPERMRFKDIVFLASSSILGVALFFLERI